MVRPVHLDDEAPASADEVADVACQRHLAAKGDPQLAIGELCPEQLLGGRDVRAHRGGASGEQCTALERRIPSAHGSLSRPAKRPDAANPAQAPCQAPAAQCIPPQAWRGACATGAVRTRPGRERRAHERAFPTPLLRLTQLLLALVIVVGVSREAYAALATTLTSHLPQQAGAGPSHGRPQRSEDGRLGGAGRAQAEGRARNRVGIENDALGNLSAASYADGKVDLRMPDAVGNLFRTTDRSDRKYGPAGELLESHDPRGTTRYDYDPEGNLIKKTEPGGSTWLYSWNGAGLLQSVTRPDGHVVTFTYDALARRLSKTYRGKTTKWVWDGNVPLHEWVERDAGAVDQDFTVQREEDAVAVGERNLKALLSGRPANGPPQSEASATSLAKASSEGTIESPVTWLFEPESFAPLAKGVDHARITLRPLRRLPCSDVRSRSKSWAADRFEAWLAA